jgi:hypothetical protein
MKATKSAADQAAINLDTHLEGLARRLRQWRARQHSKGSLPQWVWDEAAEAAPEHGVSRVARVLGLDYYKLKRRATAPRSGAVTNGTPAGFVELNVSPTPSLPSPWTLELSDAHGRKLTLRSPSEPSTWTALARTFWEDVR